MEELGLSEAAARLGVSTETVRRWIKRGRLQSRKADDGHVLVMVARAANDAQHDDQQAPASDQHDDQQRQVPPNLTATQNLSEWETRATVAETEAAQLRTELAGVRGVLDGEQGRREQVERERDRLAQLLDNADQERRGVLALLQREQEEHARTRAQVAMLIPKLAAPGEGEGQQAAPSRAWWRWW